MKNRAQLLIILVYFASYTFFTTVALAQGYSNDGLTPLESRRFFTAVIIVVVVGGVTLGIIFREQIYAAFHSHPAEHPIHHALDTGSSLTTPEIGAALLQSGERLDNPPLGWMSKVDAEKVAALNKLIEEEGRTADATLQLEIQRAKIKALDEYNNR